MLRLRGQGQRVCGRGEGSGRSDRVRSSSGEDRGAAGLLLPVGGSLLVAAAAAAGLLVAGSTVHTRAESVADMVALGAAGALLDDPGPCPTAADLAAANRARLHSCEVAGAVVAIEVAVPLPRALAGLTGREEAEAAAAAELVVAQ